MVTRGNCRVWRGPFRYGVNAVSYLKVAQRYAQRPVKRAVISASALSPLYPQNRIAGYAREAFLADLVAATEKDFRECLEANAACVQIDFTEGRLALQLDPSGGLLRTFVELNNRVLSAFSDSERKTIGVHTCPGGDRDSTHSADVDYTRLLPDLFQMKVGRFYIQLASEVDRKCVLKSIAGLLKPGPMVFVGVTDPIDPKIESPEVVRDRVMEAAEFIPLESLGTTDDCGFSPFADDTSTSRETAFAKIRARVEGTAMARKKMGVGVALRRSIRVFTPLPCASVSAEHRSAGQARAPVPTWSVVVPRFASHLKSLAKSRREVRLQLRRHRLHSAEAR